MHSSTFMVKMQGIMRNMGAKRGVAPHSQRSLKCSLKSYRSSRRRVQYPGKPARVSRATLDSDRALSHRWNHVVIT